MATNSEADDRRDGLMTVHRTVQYHKSNNVYMQNIPNQARDIIGIDKGDDLEIEIHEDGYFVRPIDRPEE